MMLFTISSAGTVCRPLALGESPDAAEFASTLAARARADPQTDAPSNRHEATARTRRNTRSLFWAGVNRIRLLSKMLASKIPRAGGGRIGAPETNRGANRKS